MVAAQLSVAIFGAGKVGRGLARELRKAGATVSLRPGRKGLPKGKAKLQGDIVILAVRDRELGPTVEQIVQLDKVDSKAVVVHVAGSQGPAVLFPLRAVCAGVAQMHPMISFADPNAPPALLRGNVRIEGDATAVKRATALAKLLGMTPRRLPDLDTVGYHAAAGLVANGAAALAALGSELLTLAGVPADEAPRLLGPLLRSVADNVEALGFPHALTGPVRRGDAAGVAKHLELLRKRLPRAVDLYVAASRAQLPLARALGESPAENFDAIETALQSS